MKYLFTILIVATNLQSFAQKKHTVLFDLGKYEVNAGNKSKLDSLIYNEVLHPGVKLSLIGYTDFIGDTASNMLLSQKRAEAVKAYLISMGFKETNLKTVQWKGELFAKDTISGGGIPQDRKVDIIAEEQTATVNSKEFVNDISKLKINSIVRLNIFFIEMTHRYKDSSLSELQALLRFMKKNPTIKVRIEGHICCGNWNRPRDDGYDLDTRKQDLSVARAREVYEYLIKSGVTADRMSYKGFAFTSPLYPDEKNQWEKNQNKRVEVRIIEK